MPDARETFAAALRHHQAGRLGEAERLYREVLQIDPGHADAWQFLGVLAHQSGRNDVAVDMILKAVSLNDRVPAFHNNLGNALKALGRWEEAVASYHRALALKPDLVAAFYNLGLTRHAQGNLTEAASSYERALALKPDYAEAHSNLGNVYQAQGRLDEAVASYGRAIYLKPDYAEAHSNLGNVLKAQGKIGEALASFERALKHKPDSAEPQFNLGLLFLDQGSLSDAVGCFERALALKPEYPEAHHYLGNALREQGKSEEALACYRRALDLKPDYAAARLGAAVAVIPLFAGNVDESASAADRFSRSLDELRAWSQANPGRVGKAVGSHQPFYLAYRPGEVGGMVSRYGELVSADAAFHWRPKVNPRPHPLQRRIRMVVVSGHVHHHPVWNVVLKGIIAHMDRTRFEIFLYHTGSRADGETDWAKRQVDRFVQGPKSTPMWLEEIVRDQPDVLFYPEVGMDPATGALAALKLAPLQVAGWGHPLTTGLPSIQWYLSGELLEGEGADAHYRERLIRLPGTGVCTEPIALETERWNGPDRQRGVVRFALCHQPIKFDPADDELLARIAREVQPSEFWLVSPNTLNWTAVKLRERLAGAFRSQGLDPDARLFMTPWMPSRQFAGFLDEMDIYLDCPNFSGYTTAWQAIHRGLPIVTCEGEYLRQRLAAGLLRQVGLIEGIAASRDRYVEIAVQWARESVHSALWDDRRAELRRAAPKADGNRAAVREFERALVNSFEMGQTGAP